MLTSPLEVVLDLSSGQTIESVAQFNFHNMMVVDDH